MERNVAQKSELEKKANLFLENALGQWVKSEFWNEMLLNPELIGKAFNEANLSPEKNGGKAFERNVAQKSELKKQICSCKMV